MCLVGLPVGLYPMVLGSLETRHASTSLDLCDIMVSLADCIYGDARPDKDGQ